LAFGVGLSCGMGNRCAEQSMSTAIRFSLVSSRLALMTQKEQVR
jgi:hypothetical protein